MITVTPSAVSELKRLRSKYQEAGSQPILRLGVKPSGCSGLSYTMNFEGGANPDDQTFAFDDISVAVDPLSMTLLSGIEVDFSEDLLGGGFRFRNPNAVASCGCGTSFATAATA
ncbi:MAG: iron-sulfur cluster assembly accessory protein [Cyanobacteriota bacterium]|nr:iron-sulfur cluster assembly accessory protein [Cyanobacteriota bacterium]